MEQEAEASTAQFHLLAIVDVDCAPSRCSHPPAIEVVVGPIGGNGSRLHPAHASRSGGNVDKLACLGAETSLVAREHNLSRVKAVSAAEASSAYIPLGRSALVLQMLHHISWARTWVLPAMRAMNTMNDKRVEE